MTDLSITRKARVTPDALCVLCEGRTYTYQHVAIDAARVGANLEARGVLKSAQPIAFVARNDYATLCLIYALLELGIPIMPLHAAWSAREVQDALEQGAGTPLEATLVDAYELGIQHLPAATSESKAFRLPPLSRPPAPPEALAAILFSSGTTGAARGVCLTRGAFIASAEGHTNNLGWQPEDRWMLTLPLAHVGGLSVLTRCLIAGKTLVLPLLKSGQDFGASVLAQLECTSTSLLSLVPTQLRRIIEAQARQAESAPSALRAVLLGGAAIEPALLSSARANGWPIALCYGSTESCSQVAAQHPTEPSSLFGVGFGLSHAQLRIEQGELWIKSRALYTGIYPAPQGRPDWYRSGDRAQFDTAGRLHILGRLDEVVITGGENVEPGSVELILNQHASVRESCVVGLPDPEWGEQLVALVVPRGQPDPEALKEYCRTQLARFRIPKRFLWVEALPLTPSAKNDRNAARALARELVSE